MQTRDAGARGREARQEALGDRLPELRVRPGGGRQRSSALMIARARPDVEFVRAGRAARARSTPGRGGAGADRRQARRDLLRRCSAPTWRASCARASCAACSRTARCSTCWRGEPEYLDPLKDEAPVGWCVTGYPWYAIDTPEHTALPRCLPGKRSTTTRAWARWSATATMHERRGGDPQGRIDRHARS
ncbi:MAG: hypothetical protein MZW92_40105 [Comamonadaceae bacterium]|nr:hypothetical protein [Comamonadaceae bacterium]